MVRLKEVRQHDVPFHHRRFNSTMVRLKEGDVTLDDLRELEFQFHNGSIKRRAGRRGRGWFFQFQFHNGSIKRRLLSGPHGLLIMFQFHNGSIKRIQSGESHRVSLEFQFHNGSIKSVINPETSEFFKPVSIPQWFD